MDFFKLFAYLPESLVVVSPEYKILAATDLYLDTTMRKREDIIGLHFLKEAFPDKVLSYEDNPVKQALDKASATKQTVALDILRYDLQKPEAEGGGFETRFWEVSHTPVLNAAGEVEYLIQKATDVTEREITKIALSESENKFQFMAETLPQLIFTTNPEGNLTYLNQRWANYTGVPLPDLMNSGWENIIHPEDLPNIRQRWDEAIKNGKEVQFELRKRGQNGAYRWFLCKTLPMQNSDGSIAMWVGSCSDIHDMRQMVKELLETNEQMATLSDQVQEAYSKAEAERKILESMFMKAPAFFCILDGPEHTYTLVNEKYQQLFPSRQLLGKTVAEAVPEVIEQGFIKILDEVYETGKEFVAEEIPVKFDLHDTGNIDDVYLTFIYQPIYNEAKKITGILVFGNVVNEQVKYRKRLQELGQA
jgi:PAS domain S-box-containing protein